MNEDELTIKINWNRKGLESETNELIHAGWITDQNENEGLKT